MRGLVMLAAAVMASPAGAFPWAFEEIEPFGSTWDIEVEVRDGVVLALYPDFGPDDLRIATRTSTGWSFEIVDTGTVGDGVVFRNPNWVFTPGGDPIIAYGHQAPVADVKIARKISGAWVHELVMPGFVADGRNLAMDDDGYLHLIVSDGDLYHYATDASGAWVTEVLPETDFGASSAILFDDAGQLHAWTDTRGLLVHSVRTETGWRADRIFFWEDGIFDLDAQLGPDGRIYLTFITGYPDRFVWLGVLADEEWTFTPELDTAGRTHQATDIDPDGVLHVAYTYLGQGLRYATIDDGVTTFDDSVTPDQNWAQGIAVAEDGVHIVFRTDSDDPIGLRYAFNPSPTVGVGAAGAIPGRVVTVRPNPNPGIDFTLAGATALTTADILDVAGRLVRSAVVEGGSRVSWDGRDGSGRRVAPGVYLVHGAGPKETVRARLIVVE